MPEVTEEQSGGSPSTSLVDAPATQRSTAQGDGHVGVVAARHALADLEDPSRLPMSVLSLLVLLLGLVGWAAGDPVAKATGFLLYALIGFGGACLLALRNPRWPSLAFSAPLGLSLAILVGFVLVETRTWAAGTPVFVAAGSVAALLHLQEVFLGARRWRARGQTLRWPGLIRRKATHASSVDRRSRHLQALAIGLAFIGLAACAASSSALNDFDPSGPRALLGAINPAWYVGMACIVAGIVVGFVAVSTSAVALSVVSLQLAVTLTPALAYNLPRYSWTYKHLGVTSYILLHGSVNPNIDIYQAWPGLFAGVAWACHAIGVQNPIPIARWWPTVIDLLRLFAFQRLAVRVLRDNRRSWLASAIVVAGNMIGQDYYSPQATGFFLAIAVFAVVYRRPGEDRRISATEWPLVLAMIVAISVTHQLSPYMLAAAVIVLALFGLSRSYLVPIITLVCAAGWALLHFTTVRRYFNFNQFGHIATNVLTRGQVRASHTSRLHKAALIHLNAYAMATVVAVIAVLALLVLIQRRSKVHLALALCAASGVGLLVTNSYGNEGVFRVVLFALPWAAILCSDWDAASAPRLHWLPIAALPLLLAGYLFVDMGLDYIYATRVSDLKAIQTFESTAPSGSRLCILGRSYAPIKSSGRYNEFEYRDDPYVAYDGIHHFNPKTAYDDFLIGCLPQTQHALRHRSFYVLGAQQPEANLIELGLATHHEYAALESEIARSGNWQLVERTKTAQLYKLTSLFGDTVRPSITGDVQDGFQLTANRGTWTSLNELGFGWQWESCTANGSNCLAVPGATHKSFFLRAAQVGHRMRVIVSATDASGITRVVTTRLSSVVAKPTPPIEFVAPSITGTAESGQRLTALGGKWRSPDHLTRSYQWEECTSSGTHCADILGATKPSLDVRFSMVGHDLAVAITVTDQEGQSSRAVVPAVGPVVKGPRPTSAR